MVKKLLIVTGAIVILAIAVLLSNVFLKGKEENNNTSANVIEQEVPPTDLPELILDEEVMEEVSATEDENFVQIGTLLSFDDKTGEEGDDWSLLFDKPGASVNKVSLQLGENAICGKGEAEKECSWEDFSNGIRVKVVGTETESGVVVLRLETVEE